MSTVSEKGSILHLSTEKKIETIRHEFTQEETNDMRETIANNLMKLMDIQDEFKKVKEEFKAKMEPFAQGNKLLLRLVRQRYDDVEMEVYLVPDYENRIMDLYTRQGIK